MGCIWRAIRVNCVISITMVCNNNSLIIISLSSLDNLLYTMINRPNSLCDSMINTRVTYHITISKVHNNEVVLLCIDSSNKLIFHFESTHLRL